MISNEERQEVMQELRRNVLRDQDVSMTAVIKALGIELDGDESWGELCEAVWDRMCDLIDRPTCVMDDLGNFTPHHDFKRMVCSVCGAMHWEQPQETLRMRYCPWCGREVVE